MSDMIEPVITINGVRLNGGQAMTVRVAVSNFMVELSDPDMLKDLGAIGPLYRARLGEIYAAMMLNQPPPSPPHPSRSRDAE